MVRIDPSNLHLFDGSSDSSRLIYSAAGLTAHDEDIEYQIKPNTFPVSKVNTGRPYS